MEEDRTPEAGEKKLCKFKHSFLLNQAMLCCKFIVFIEMGKKLPLP
jgi:hypothetical protein